MAPGLSSSHSAHPSQVLGWLSEQHPRLSLPPDTLVFPETSWTVHLLTPQASQRNRLKLNTLPPSFVPCKSVFLCPSQWHQWSRGFSSWSLVILRLFAFLLLTQLPRPSLGPAKTFLQKVSGAPSPPTKPTSFSLSLPQWLSEKLHWIQTCTQHSPAPRPPLVKSAQAPHIQVDQAAQPPCPPSLRQPDAPIYSYTPVFASPLKLWCLANSSAICWGPDPSTPTSPLPGSRDTSYAALIKFTPRCCVVYGHSSLCQDSSWGLSSAGPQSRAQHPQRTAASPQGLHLTAAGEDRAGGTHGAGLTPPTWQSEGGPPPPLPGPGTPLNTENQQHGCV